MIVRGVRPEGNFYVLSKAISEDGRLSWAARGLLVYLLGKPDHWQVSPAALVNETKGSAKATGRDGVYSLLSELITAGYVVRSQARGDGGVLGATTYIVNEAPLPAFPDTAAPLTPLPHTANPTVVSIELKQELKQQRREAAREKIEFNFETGSFDGPLCDHFGRWTAAFPAVQVDAEVLRAGAWLLANPKNKKSNYLAFLTNWLSRAQDRARPGQTQNTFGAQPYDRTNPRPRPSTIHEQRSAFGARLAERLDEAGF